MPCPTWWASDGQCFTDSVSSSSKARYPLVLLDFFWWSFSKCSETRWVGDVPTASRHTVLQLPWKKMRSIQLSGTNFLTSDSTLLAGANSTIASDSRHCSVRLAWVRRPTRLFAPSDSHLCAVRLASARRPTRTFSPSDSHPAHFVRKGLVKLVFWFPTDQSAKPACKAFAGCSQQSLGWATEEEAIRYSLGLFKMEKFFKGISSLSKDI